MRGVYRSRKLWVWAIVLVLVAGQAVLGQKRAIGPEDYDKWERLGRGALSPDGAWVTYSITPVEGDGTLYLKNLETDKEYEYLVGSGLVFSDDSQWASFRVGVPKEERERLEKANKPVKSKTFLLNLKTDEKEELEGVSGVQFSENSKYTTGRLAGRNILIRNLGTGATLPVGNVGSFAFNEVGDRLAYIVDATDKAGNGVVLVDLSDFSFKVLESGAAKFTNLVWHEDGGSLAYMRSIEDEDYEEDNYKVVVFRDIYGDLDKKVFDPREDRNFPREMRITDEYRPVWGDDMSAMFLGIKGWTKKEKPVEKEAEEGEKEEQEKKDKEKDLPPPGVDVWHWRDAQIQPLQQKRYASEQRFSYLSVWHIDEGEFVQIARGDQKSASLTGDQKHAIVRDLTPYEPAFLSAYADVYLADTQDGERKMILEKFYGTLGSSPGGKYLLYFKDKQWWTYDIEGGRHINLTEKTGVDFWNTRDDHPRKERPAFGSGGWLKDDKGVLLYDEYDVWRFAADGSGYERVTEGYRDEIQLRVQRLDREEDFIDLDKPLYLRANGDKTKKSGYFRRSPAGRVERLIFEDMNVSGVAKAKYADKYLYTAQSYVKSPNLFLTDGAFEEREQLTDTNPQQQDFLWGRAELIDYVNADGKEMQGALYYPAGYEEGKKYPMLIYIYEIVSNGLHRYVMPSKTSSYNLTNYVSQGYFVFQPDIVYKLDHPGESAVDCVVPAVKEVIKTGMIDEKGIGIMGHSWGAYQTAFIITQTDLFSAAAAGAPLTDMISMYTEIYWNSGSGNQVIFETSQGRFTRPYWEILDEYMDNSPMFQAGNIKTPLMVAFGDQDGAVDWHQGIEMYSTMRRMEKEMILLVYAGENHSVAKEENRLDYTRRINEFFDHHLKGKEAPKWITEGVSYKEKMKKIKK